MLCLKGIVFDLYKVSINAKKQTNCKKLKQNKATFMKMFVDSCNVCKMTIFACIEK